MIHLYSIHDIKARSWSEPQSHQSEEALMQFLSVIINTHGCGPQHTNPEDFVVYKVAEFNEDTGQMAFLEDKAPVTTFSSLKTPCKHCIQEQEEQSNG